jgi:phytanoyl-CoA hydroxylase
MKLTEAQSSEYFEQGYLVLPGLIEAAALQDYNQRFIDLVEGRVPLATGMKIMQDVMVVKGAVQPQTPLHGVNKMLCLEEDEVLFGFARHRELVSAVQSLVGEVLYSLSSNVFNKPPGVDGKHPMHQDLRYFKLEPADKIVGVWTAMLPATRETGCLAVIPGSHKRGMLKHENPDWEFVNYGFFGIEEVNLEDRIHVELAPGDTLLFHPLLIHGSGTNKGVDFRRAISVHFASGDCVSSKGEWRTNAFTRRVA